MRILIENGEVFDGTEDMLDDCFGIRLDELDDWCNAHGWMLNINECLLWDAKTKTWIDINGY